MSLWPITNIETFEYFLVFWNYNIVQAQCASFLPHPYCQPFLKGVLVLEHGIRIQDWALGMFLDAVASRFCTGQHIKINMCSQTYRYICPYVFSICPSVSKHGTLLLSHSSVIWFILAFTPISLFISFEI